jgi:hypothetical protein
VSSRSGDELIEFLLSEEADPDEQGVAANDLLAQVQHGYPAQNLSRLIHSSSSRAVANGAFVVSELGAQAAQIINEVDFLLDHPLRDARFDALDAALTSASGEHGAVLAKAVMLIADPDQAVRKKAIKFLANATRDQLAAAIPYLADRHVADLVTWLDSAGSDPASLPEIRSRLHAPDKPTRMFAAAAAARVAEITRQGIEDAAASDDSDIRSFAGNVIEILDLRQEIRARQEQRRRDRSTPGA